VRITFLVLPVMLAVAQSKPAVDLEQLPYAPRQTVCYRASSRLTIDGKLDEASWRAAAWSEPFIDIQGPAHQPQPRFRTRAKMLWDDEFLYIAAELDEPDVWGTITRRDAVIFHDNDFEVFIDPDGDTHAYYELEVNALGTAWDLMLLQPYRDGGPPIDGWDIAGLQVGVDVRGTINKPGDRDEGWAVEMALPWKALREAAPGQKAPRAGDRWRINFSRVEWQTDVKDGAYAKRLNAGTGKPLPEDNWVWSPQGAIDMHMPERWGIVQFSDTAVDATGTTGTTSATREAGPAGAATMRMTPLAEDPNDQVKWALRRLYYRQRQFRAAHGRYAADLAALDAGNIRVDGLDFRPSLQVTDSLYEITASGFAGAIVHLRQDGKVWLTR
jgi:hypothetical protein